MINFFTGTGIKGEFQLLAGVEPPKTYTLIVSDELITRQSYKRYAGVFQTLLGYPRPQDSSQIWYDQIWLPSTLLNVRYDFGTLPTIIFVYWYEDVEQWTLAIDG